MGASLKSTGIAVGATSPALGGVVGAVTGGVFGVLGKKRKIEALKEETKKTQTSVDTLQAAIDKMEFLLKDAQTINTQLTSDSTCNYEMMSSQQQAELLQSVAELNTLSEALSGKLSA